MKNGICPKCNSHVIVENIPIPDRGHYSIAAGSLYLVIKGKRTSMFSNRFATGEIRAWICGECGYTELYTSNFKDILEADREAKIADKK